MKIQASVSQRLLLLLCTCTCCPGPWSLHKAFSVGGRGASHRSGFSCCGAAGSGAREPGRCGAAGLVTLGMWELPRLGIKPTSSALAGGVLTIGPPGKAGIFCCNDSIPLSVLAYANMWPSLKY